MTAIADPVPPTLRDAQRQAVRDHVVAMAMALLERGEEPTMRAVAQAAGIAERTIYRYFASHEALIEALGPELRRRSGVPLCATAGELADYAATLYGTFDENRALVRALATSPWARPFLDRTRARNLGQLRDLLDAAFPDADPDARAAAASSLRVLLSGSGWLYLDQCGLDLTTATAHARWAVRTTLAALERPHPTKAEGAPHA